LHVNESSLLTVSEMGFSKSKKTLFLSSANGHIKIEPLKLQSKETPSSSIQTVLSVLELHQFSPQ